MGMYEVKVSIIIPVYNKEKYIRKTLESVVSQTFTDYEVIIINDGSTDNSLSIIEEFSQKYKQIQVYTIPNGGVSNARNVGLKYAKGEWIQFLDGDDYLALDSLEYINNKFKETNFDILHYQLYEIYDLDNIHPKEGKLEEKCINVKDGVNLDDFKQLQGMKFAMNAKFLNSNKIRFYDSDQIHEDVYFTVILKSLATKIFFTSKIIYFYDRTRSSSITHIDNEKENYKLFCIYLIRAYNWMVANKKDLSLFNMHAIYYMVKFIGHDEFKGYGDLFYNDNYYLKNRKVSLKWRIIYFFYKHKSLHPLFNFLFNQKWLRKIVRG